MHGLLIGGFVRTLDEELLQRSIGHNIDPDNPQSAGLSSRTAWSLEMELLRRKSENVWASSQRSQLFFTPAQTFLGGRDLRMITQVIFLETSTRVRVSVYWV